MTTFKRVAHALDELKAEVDTRWPGRSKVSDGTLGDTAHAARKSDHNPDGDGIVRARDITEWDPGTPGVEADDVAEVIAETIRARRDPRVKYVIWRGRMFSSYSKGGRAAWEWGEYTGPNGHFHHVHVSVHPGAQGDAGGPWGLHGGTPVAAREAMRNGSKGPAVEWVQACLQAIAKRWPDKVPMLEKADGVYGPKTVEAVLAFEKMHNAFLTAFRPKDPKHQQDGIATVPTQDAITWWAQQAQKG
jgi:hypothetical protein